jgi:hypothetical protein
MAVVVLDVDVAVSPCGLAVEATAGCLGEATTSFRSLMVSTAVSAMRRM